MENAFDELLTTEFFLVVVGIFALIWTLRKSFSQFFKNKVILQFMPMLPLVLGVLAMVTIPGLSNWDAVGARVLHGLFAGFFAGHFHKLGKQTILAPLLEKYNGNSKEN